MHRFHCPSLEKLSLTITLDNPREIHHLKDVLRLKKGDTVILFNGRGGEAQGKITNLSVHAVTLSISDFQNDSGDGPRLVLACAVPKRSKFEMIVEKATELGADEIIPLQTRRTEIRYTEDKRKTKQKRFEAVALAAAKQCQRSRLPVVHSPTSFARALKLIDEKTLALIPWLEGDRQDFLSALEDASTYSRVMVFIGPEGDFTPSEVEAAKSAGCRPVSLGPTVLRVETAAIATVAVLRLFNCRKSGK